MSLLALLTTGNQTFDTISVILLDLMAVAIIVAVIRRYPTR